MSRLFSRAGWAVACTAVFLLSVESTVRLDDWAQHGVPLSSGATRLIDLLVTDSAGTHTRPGTSYRQFRVNRLGFRGADTEPAVLARSFLVVTAGASETFGLYESRDKEWPAQLQETLRRTCPTTPWLVQNAAFAGMSIPAVVRDIDRRLAPLSPRVVIYYPTPMQYLEAEPPTREVRRGIAAPEPPWWRLRSAWRFRDAVKRATPETVLDWLRVRDTRKQRADVMSVWSAPPRERLEQYEADLRWLVGAIRKTGAQPVLVVHQNRFRDTTSADSRRWLRAWERFYPQATGGAIVAFGALAGDRTRVVALDSGAILVDPTGKMHAASGELFADFSHFSDAGSAIMAAETSRALVASVGCTQRSGSGR